MSNITLNWNNASITHAGQKIYKSLTPLVLGSLPPALTELSSDVRTYTDVDVVNGTTYYYRVSTFTSNEELFSEQLEIVAQSGGAGGDIYWSNVTSLMHFNDDLVDEKGITWSKSGSSGFAAGVFDKALSATGGLVGTSSALSAFNLGTGDFTIEMFAGHASKVAQFPALLTLATTTTSGWGIGYFQMSFNRSDSANRFTVWAYNSGVHPMLTSASTYDITSIFVHVALCRSGNVFTLFIGGIVAATFTSTASMTGDSVCQIGGGGVGNTSNYFNGRIDEFRLTKGVARYTTPFTPPAAPFPNN